MRLTKIIATVGPASAEPRVLRALLRAGTDVVRLNFSHGTRSDHARMIGRVRRAAALTGRAVAILADLQGPRARIGGLPLGPIRLRRGEVVTLTDGDHAGPGRIPTSLRNLGRAVAPGDPILIDDGRLALRVVRVRGHDVVARVMAGGLLHQHKGLNLPRCDVSLPALTRKDFDDLDFAVRRGVDAIALSFVRGAADVARVRRLLARRGLNLPIIAKLERRAAILRLEEILAAADGVMVARGDLGVEEPLERVPVLQKTILHRAHRAGVLTVTATQMLESMVDQPLPTRAEVSDVANAVFDGSDAVMLSAETASGRWPIRAVRVMDRVARAAERSGLRGSAQADALPGEDAAAHAVAHAARDAAVQSGAGAIIAYTRTGQTARILSKLRPPCPILAITPSEEVRRQMALWRGVVGVRLREERSTDRMLAAGERALLRQRLVRRGQQVVIVSGARLRSPSAHLMTLRRIGEPRPQEAASGSSSLRSRTRVGSKPSSLR